MDAFEVVTALTERYRSVEALRRGSGGKADDPNTGHEWYRAQLVALRDLAERLDLPLPADQGVERRSSRS